MPDLSITPTTAGLSSSWPRPLRRRWSGRRRQRLHHRRTPPGSEAIPHAGRQRQHGLSRRRGRRPPTPGTVFRDIDAPWCPEMVVIPDGRFLMGSPESEEGRRRQRGAAARGPDRAPVRTRALRGDVRGVRRVRAGRRATAHRARSAMGPRPDAGGERVVARRSGLLPSGCRGRRERTTVCRRGGMGVCLPGRNNDTVQLRGNDLARASELCANYAYRGGPTGLYRQRTVPVGRRAIAEVGG